MFNKKDCRFFRPKNGRCYFGNVVCKQTKECDNYESKYTCGWWSCGSRGCGNCPDCYGEVCTCNI